MTLEVFDASTSGVWAIAGFLLSSLTFAIWRRRAAPAVVPDEFEYELAAVCVAANEASYIKEWLTWHRNQGVEHFFYYDNDAQENDYEELFGASLLAYVTVERWVGKKARFFGQLTPQRQAYNHVMKKHASKCRHILVCDADEFCMPAPGCSHESMIDAIRDLPKNVAWLEITRRNFGHRPHQTRPEGGVVENYVWRAALQPEQDFEKSLVSGAIASHLTWSFGVHRPKWKRWKCPLRSRDWITVADNERLLRVNHYYTKSAEEWKARGRFWSSSIFNKSNGTRVDWNKPPSELFSKVRDEHALNLKAKMVDAPASTPNRPPR